MESYYMILVTKRTKCGVIDKHIIYTIKDTHLIRVCEPTIKQTHPLEQRYLRMFMNIDLNSNFYFSYSYDLTRTLQHNLSAPKFIGNADIENEEPLPDWNSYVWTCFEIVLTCLWKLTIKMYFFLQTENQRSRWKSRICYSKCVPQTVRLECVPIETDGIADFEPWLVAGSNPWFCFTIEYQYIRSFGVCMFDSTTKHTICWYTVSQAWCKFRRRCC